MFAAIGAAFSFLFGLFQTGIDIIVEGLVWAVNALWAFAVLIYNGVKSVGSLLATGFQKSWGFFRTVYDDVLKPAWDKFWQLFDKVRAWLKATFGPLIKFLLAVRDELLCLYKTWIRPVLDAIDATRGILRVLEALHIKWAAQLDAELGAIEDWINRQFLLVLSKLNEAINLVDRVVTADGLFQRAAFIRTYARDIQLAASVFWQSQVDRTRKRPEGIGDAKLVELTDPAEYRDGLSAFYRDHSGAYAPPIDELVSKWQMAAGYPQSPELST